MPEIDLIENEKIIKKFKGDFWNNTFLFLYEQQGGEIILTNLRIVFISKVFNIKKVTAQIMYQDIENIENCNVGTVIPLNPTGIKINIKNGQSCKLSSYHRGKIMDLINQMIMQN